MPKCCTINTIINHYNFLYLGKVYVVTINVIKKVNSY